MGRKKRTREAAATSFLLFSSFPSPLRRRVHLQQFNSHACLRWANNSNVANALTMDSSPRLHADV